MGIIEWSLIAIFRRSGFPIEESKNHFQDGSLILAGRESIEDSDLIFHDFHMKGDVHLKEEGIALLKRCFGVEMSDLIDQAYLRGMKLINLFFMWHPQVLKKWITTEKC